MANRRLLEVVSGLGLGGAERALFNRMKYIPSDFEQVILNVRPEIDTLKLDPTAIEYSITRRGVFRLFDIFKFINRNWFDIIIVRTPFDAVRFGFLKLLKRNQAPKIIFEAHSNFVSKKSGANLLLRIFLLVVYPKIDLIIAVSQNVSRGPLCRGHKNVQVVYLGAQLEGSVNLATKPGTARLVFIGRLIELKQPVWLLERIFAIHSRETLPKRSLTIIGAGPMEREVQSFIVAHNLEGMVDFVGEQTNITPYLMSSTHLVSCSTNEGLPLTFFEAKLAGLAILSTPSGGGAEIFDDYDRELGSFEKDEFENALITIFSNPPPTLEDRKRIQANSSWMSAERSAREYYFRLSQLLQP